MPEFLDVPGGERIAYHVQRGRSPWVVFFPGFNSTMVGRKAAHLASLCTQSGHGFVRFDYRGHGQSSGELHDGDLSQWLADARAVIALAPSVNLVLVGASIGGWLMLLLARELGARVQGLVGIGAGVDITDAMLARLSVEQTRALRRDGITWRSSRYGDGPYPLTQRMLDESRRHHILGTGLTLACPLHLFHGLEDPDLPWRSGLDILHGLCGEDIRLTLLNTGDHRLSRPSDLDAIGGAVTALL
jgi:pimeloyl-ACP methyl ester carboxylesterase